MTNENNNPPTDERSEVTRKSPEELAQDLTCYSGLNLYTPYGLGISHLTEGVKYLAQQAQCYWLLDAIGSYQGELAKHHDERLQCLQFWRLKVNADQSAVLTCVADSGEPPAVTQEIAWTDFPLPEIDIWVGVEEKTKIALLPSEY